MQLISIIDKKNKITFSAEYNAGIENVNADESRKVTCPEMPLPEFGEALQGLTVVVCEVMSFPKDYVNGMVIKGFAMSYTKAGTRSMEISFEKQLDMNGGKSHPLKTPMFRIDPPQDGDSGSLDISKKNAELCARAVIEAKNYAHGQRAQMTFAQFAEENGALSKAESDDLTLEV